LDGHERWPFIDRETTIYYQAYTAIPLERCREMPKSDSSQSFKIVARFADKSVEMNELPALRGLR